MKRVTSQGPWAVIWFDGHRWWSATLPCKADTDLKQVRDIAVESLPPTATNARLLNPLGGSQNIVVPQ